MRHPWRRRVSDRSSSFLHSVTLRYCYRKMTDSARAGNSPRRLRRGSLRSEAVFRQARIGNVIGVEPCRIGPAVFVVFRHALLGELHHLAERAGATRVPQRLDTDVFVIAGV